MSDCNYLKSSFAYGSWILFYGWQFCSSIIGFRRSNYSLITQTKFFSQMAFSGSLTGGHAGEETCFCWFCPTVFVNTFRESVCVCVYRYRGINKQINKDGHLCITYTETCVCASVRLFECVWLCAFVCVFVWVCVSEWVCDCLCICLCCMCVCECLSVWV